MLPPWLNVGFAWLAIATLLTGFWFVLLKQASRTASPIAVQILNVTGTIIAIAIPVLVLCLRQGYSWKWGSHWHYAMLAGILIGSANLCMFKAYAHLPLAVVVPALNLACIIPILAGLVIYKERLHPLQGVGILLAIAAVLLLTYPYEQPPIAPEATSGEAVDSAATSP